MKKFNIKVISRVPEEVDGELCYGGKISINKFKEIFGMAIDNWTLQDYKKQWKNGLERIITYNTSCLMVDITNLKKKYPSTQFYALYKAGTTVFIMRKIMGGKIFKEVKKGPESYYFDTCYEFMPPRVTNSKGNAINYDGYELVEHVIDIQDVNDFLASYKEK